MKFYRTELHRKLREMEIGDHIKVQSKTYMPQKIRYYTKTYAKDFEGYRFRTTRVNKGEDFYHVWRDE